MKGYYMPTKDYRPLLSSMTTKVGIGNVLHSSVSIHI